MTQQLNTTDSVGRLTLNILLSFAQFERELIAERTRDKMRAARRKGKWSGGKPVLGYEVDAQGGGLKMNSAEASQVRVLFQLIIEANSWEAVLEEVSGRGWKTKQWVSRSGRQHLGRAFQRLDLIRLVRNAMYLGMLREGEQLYAGEHAAIIDSELWKRANAALECLGGSRAKPGPSTRTERKAEAAAPASPPRLTRLLALALKMEEMVEQSTVLSYAELARRGQVSAARITQIMNLVNLAPAIQEAILSLETGRSESPREAAVRKIASLAVWGEQLRHWQALMTRRNIADYHSGLAETQQPEVAIKN